MNMKRAIQRRSFMRAIPLEERIDIATNAAASRRLSGREAAYARKVISRWKLRAAFKDGAFPTWLAKFGIDEQQLASIVQMRSTAALRGKLRHQPLWRSFRALRNRAKVEQFSPPHDGHEALLHLVQPFIESTIASLLNELETLRTRSSGRHFEVEHVIGLCRRDIVRNSIYLIQKTCLLELQVAGLRGDLDGADGVQRYRSFVERISTSSGREAVFQEYPLLLSVVVARLRMYHHTVIELLTALTEDIDAIERDLLDGVSLGKLQNWAFGSGDSHREGRSVTVLTFEGETRLVYKPRSMRIDEGFNELLTWCNTQLPDPPLRGVKTLNCGSHGWCEFIPHRALQSADEARDFFHRQGKFLALFYALHASDMHYENMIACGVDPIYIDLETLFHAQLLSPAPDGSRSGAWPMTVADTLIISSSRAIPEVKASSPDLTIFGARPGQDMNIRVLRLARAGTDRAGLEEKEVTFDEKNHLPALGSEWLAAEHYADQIKGGFIEMYRMLAVQVPFLISEDGIPKFFRNAEVRLVFRPTQLYATLIDTSLHPDYLGDALERRVFFEQMHVADVSEQWRNDLLASEIADIEQLDVPYFAQHFESGQVYDSRGILMHGLRLPSARDTVLGHISLIGENDLRVQLALIDAAMRRPGESAVAVEPSRAFARRSAETEVDAAKRVASEIADRLLAAMVVRRSDRYWLCKTVTNAVRVTTAPSIVNLYDGQLGIAVFLAEAARVLHREDCAEAAVATLRTVRRWTHDGRNNFPFLGVFTGALGLPYALARVGEALGNNEASEASVELLAAFDPDRFKGGLDIIDGAAGGVIFLGSMLRQFEQRGSPCVALIRLMGHLAERLVQNAIPQARGIGWKPQAPNQRALTGFAHGNAGYAAALYVAARHLEKPAYQEFARAAIVYENSCFSPEEHWLDLRERGSTNHAVSNKRMCAWCSGSAGVLLGRLLCLTAIEAGYADAAPLIDDARRAARIAWSEHERTSVSNLSLCHGALGNLEILALAARQPGLDQIIPEHTCRDWVMNGDRRWRCGDEFTSPVHAPAAAPGLMTGLAGIGLGFLRQVSAMVPSVLALDVGTS